MQPLKGVKVIEMSTMITASFAAMMLAEQGAEVIKIEPMELGDPMRFLGSAKGGISALFANCNRGKRSLRLDMKQPAGVEVVEALAQEADILLCNYRPGVMDKLGLSSEHLRSLNPRLIYAAVSGFGKTGPMRDSPAYDPIIQAQAGFTASQGIGEPAFVRNLTCDKITAYTVCQGVTAALYEREKSGHGQHIDLSMMDAGLYFLFPDAFMHHTLLDEDAEHRPPLADVLYELTLTKDGAVTISAGTQTQRVNLMMAIDQIHLLADERFNSDEKIVQNFAELRELLREAMSQITTADLLAKLKEHDVPAAPCLDYADVLNHPQYAACGSMDEHMHPVMGNMRRMLPPVQFAGERLPAASDSPAHGQHTIEILAELGKSQAEVDALREQGVVG